VLKDLTSLPLPRAQDSQIVLTWLTRLRWLAIAGQLLAVLVAHYALGLDFPLLPIALVILATVLSNAALLYWLRSHSPPPWIVPALLLLDVGLLTCLLYFTGGPANPFTSLYLVHIAMAVVVLGAGWTWLVVGATALSYMLLLYFHRDLAWSRPRPPWVDPVGNWVGLALVSVLIAYFIGRVQRSLRQREHELRAVREQATRNEQLAALTTLAAGAAHELGTPLATIALVAKELELTASTTSATGPESVAEDARLIRKEVERCRAILDRMRVDLIEDLKQEPGPVHLNDLIDRMRQDLRPDEQARLQVRYADGIDMLLAPSRAVQQAVSVLLRNAFDATPAEQSVTLAVHRRDGHVAFEVQDKGHGMPEDVLRRAGEPFFTTKPPGKGMGLGLFLVRLVAEKVGGQFRLRSTPGQGTVSVLELPDGR
jgi:two-component system sensor histidine kinase RegB